MSSLPLHPAIVHLPLGLAVIMPAVALGLLIAIKRGWLPSRAWLAAVALQALLVAGAFVALRTGEADEDRAEAWAQEAAIEAHEEAATAFAWAAGATLVLAAVALVPRATMRRGLTLAATGATVLVLALALRVGKAGGRIVYGSGGAPAAAGEGQGVTAAEEDDD